MKLSVHRFIFLLKLHKKIKQHFCCFGQINVYKNLSAGTGALTRALRIQAFRGHSGKGPLLSIKTVTM